MGNFTCFHWLQYQQPRSPVTLPTISHTLLAMMSKAHKLPLEMQRVARDSSTIFMLKHGDQTFFVPYSTGNRSRLLYSNLTLWQPFILLLHSADLAFDIRKPIQLMKKLKKLDRRMLKWTQMPERYSQDNQKPKKQQIKYTFTSPHFQNTVIMKAFLNATFNTEVNKGWLQKTGHHNIWRKVTKGVIP